MYGGAGCSPSQYLGQADAEAEARRRAISDSIETAVSINTETPDWLR